MSFRNRVLGVGFVILALAFAGCAMTSGSSIEPDRQFSKQSGALISTALDHMNTSDYVMAENKILETLALPNLSSYERSTAYQMLGAARYQQDDYAGAIEAFEQAIDTGGLRPAEIPPLRLNIAQLLVISEKYREGALMLEDYIAAGHPVKPQHIELLVSVWVQAEDYGRALPWAQRWFNEASPRERKHYDVLNFVYTHLGMKAEQAILAEDMKQQFPEMFQDYSNASEVKRETHETRPN